MNIKKRSPNRERFFMFLYFLINLDLTLLKSPYFCSNQIHEKVLYPVTLTHP